MNLLVGALSQFTISTHAGFLRKNHGDRTTQCFGNGSAGDIANFLADLYEQYRSINSYRSAISSTHDRVDGVNIGMNPIVARLIAGFANT